MRLLDSYISRMSAEVRSPSTVRLFTFAAYAVMLLNALYFFPLRDLIWGPYSIGLSSHPEQSVQVNFAYILDHMRVYAKPGYFLYMAAILASLLGLFKWVPRVLVFLIGWMLYYAFIPAFNSSFYIVSAFCIFPHSR